MAEEIDPTRHIISVTDWEKRPEGGYGKVPIPLDAEAAHLREVVAIRRPGQPALDNDWRSGVVAISRSRGGTIGVLLKELAARLRPGVAVGPIQADDSLSRLAADLAWHLDAARTSSEDYD
jgi:hypothetical protein